MNCNESRKDGELYPGYVDDLKKRIVELEHEKASVTQSLEDIKGCFRTCRDATSTSVSDYSTGMANGIEWCLSCLELREPNYLECGRKAEQREYVLAKFEEIDDK